MKKNCLTCGKEFRRPLSAMINGKGKYCSIKCKGMGWITSLEHNPRWKGGKSIHWSGYILVKVPNHPQATYNGYVREHRLVMEKHLGRYLLPTEDIHHLNGIKTDNRIENLELTTDRSEHLRIEHKNGLYKKHLQKLNGGFYV